jgi:hypothetical protein
MTHTHLNQRGLGLEGRTQLAGRGRHSNIQQPADEQQEQRSKGWVESDLVDDDERGETLEELDNAGRGGNTGEKEAGNETLLHSDAVGL